MRSGRVGSGRIGSDGEGIAGGDRTQRQHALGHQVGNPTYLGVVVVVGRLGEQPATVVQSVAGRRLVEKPENRKGQLEVTGHRGTPEQSRPLQGHADATGHHVGNVFASTELEAGQENASQAKRVALIRTLAAQTVASRLTTHHLTGSVGVPRTKPTPWARVGATSGSDCRLGDVLRCSHGIRLWRPSIRGVRRSGTGRQPDPAEGRAGAGGVIPLVTREPDWGGGFVEDPHV